MNKEVYKIKMKIQNRIYSIQKEFYQNNQMFLEHEKALNQAIADIKYNFNREKEFAGYSKDDLKRITLFLRYANFLNTFHFKPDWWLKKYAKSFHVAKPATRKSIKMEYKGFIKSSLAEYNPPKNNSTENSPLKDMKYYKAVSISQVLALLETLKTAYNVNEDNIIVKKMTGKTSVKYPYRIYVKNNHIRYFRFLSSGKMELLKAEDNWQVPEIGNTFQYKGQIYTIYKQEFQDLNTDVYVERLNKN